MILAGPTGLYQSSLATCGTQREYNFDYLYTDAVNRKKAMDFLDVIPNNAYVVVRTNTNPTQAGNVYIDQWKADTSLYGHNNSLYHKLVCHGLYPAGFIYHTACAGDGITEKIILPTYHNKQ